MKQAAGMWMALVQNWKQVPETINDVTWLNRMNLCELVLLIHDLGVTKQLQKIKDPTYYVWKIKKGDTMA